VSSILSVRGLRFAYPGGAEALRGVDLELHPGEVFAVVGPNGAGKTTLFRVLNMFYRPSAGRVEYRFRTARDGSQLSLRRRMAMVFQDPVLLNASVWENVAYGLFLREPLPGRLRVRLHRLGRKFHLPLPATELEARVERALGEVGLSGFTSKHARALSRGEAQRVALARALAVEPELLFLDEPTANLDPPSALLIEEVIRRANRRGTTVLLASHNIGQVRRLADRAALLVEGRIVDSGPVEELFQAPASGFIKEFVGEELLS